MNFDAHLVCSAPPCRTARHDHPRTQSGLQHACPNLDGPGRLHTGRQVRRPRACVPRVCVWAAHRAGAPRSVAYYGTTFVGYLGLLTGMRPGGWAVSAGHAHGEREHARGAERGAGLAAPLGPSPRSSSPLGPPAAGVP